MTRAQELLFLSNPNKVLVVSHPDSNSKVPLPAMQAIPVPEIAISIPEMVIPVPKVQYSANQATGNSQLIQALTLGKKQKTSSATHTNTAVTNSNAVSNNISQRPPMQVTLTPKIQDRTCLNTSDNSVDEPTSAKRMRIDAEKNTNSEQDTTPISQSNVVPDIVRYYTG